MERRFRELDARHEGAKPAVNVLTELVGQALFDLREATAGEPRQRAHPLRPVRRGSRSARRSLARGPALQVQRPRRPIEHDRDRLLERPAGGESKDEETLTA